MIETMTMDRAEATERLKAYRKALHRGADEEYEAVAAGYAAMAEGYPLVDYAIAIRGTERDEQGRPRLAIARADRRQVVVRWRHWSQVCRFSSCASEFSWMGMQANEYQARFPDGLLVRDVPMGESGSGAEGYALVPLVPGEALSAVGGTSQLKDHLILWEVEEWADRAIGARPDIDPYLLRPIHGTLAAVIAQWDLTDLERAVMAGRAVVR